MLWASDAPHSSGNIRYDLIGISCHPDIAYFIDILIRFPKIIGFHSDPGRKYLADVGAVHKSQDFRQLSMVRLVYSRKLMVFPTRISFNKSKKGQPGGLGDIGADGGLAHEEELGQIGQSQLLAEVVVHVVEDIAFLNPRPAGGDAVLLRSPALR